jgi:hypothetical protein
MCGTHLEGAAIDGDQLLRACPSGIAAHSKAPCGAGTPVRRTLAAAGKSLLAFAVWLCLTGSAAAQTQTPRGTAAVTSSGANGAAAVDELRARLDEQRALIDRRGARHHVRRRAF